VGLEIRHDIRPTKFGQKIKNQSNKKKTTAKYVGRLVSRATIRRVGADGSLQVGERDRYIDGTLSACLIVNLAGAA
jgi:hypothetical protein